MLKKILRDSLWFGLIIVCMFILVQVDKIYSVDVKEYSFNVNNSTNSMGIIMRAGDKVFGREVTEKDILQEGNIYVYQGERTRVVHRLIKCLDIKCNQSVFKGDNNRVGEIVNRTDIKYIVTRIEYGS